MCQEGLSASLPARRRRPQGNAITTASEKENDHVWTTAESRTEAAAASEPEAAAEMTQVASETISALKTSPLLLVVVVLNAGMIFALLYVANVQRDERQALTKYIFENCGKAAP